MKAFFRTPVAALLALLARGVLAKYHPIVVMVTGSVGKTSTKDAVAAALSARYFLRASEKSYNSEFGVPLTVIGAKNPWTSPIAWTKVFLEAFALILLPSHYPKLLVLEVGADRPGDLKQILKIVTPDAVVVTKLPDVPVHVEAYAGPEAVREEEFAPAYALPDAAPLIICQEDQHALRLSSKLPATIMTYGYDTHADVSLGEPSLSLSEGMEAMVTINGQQFALKANGSLGRQQLYSPAAALAVSLSLGLSVAEALKGLDSYVPPPGRARLLKGKNNSILIDDTYNASPAAAMEALAALKAADATRKIAVLGDMLELGRYSKEEHARIGKLAAESADIVVAVGTRSLAIFDAVTGAREAYHFNTSKEAAAALSEMVREGDLVLIKGSQGVRMERITQALLQNPGDSSKLVRQDPQWLKKS